jgi:hypothetical protein
MLLAQNLARHGFQTVQSRINFSCSAPNNEEVIVSALNGVHSMFRPGNTGRQSRILFTGYLPVVQGYEYQATEFSSRDGQFR